MTTRAPNLLIICADEMRGDCWSRGGNPDVRTPNLERLAARGTPLLNHFTNHTKCAPSRMVLTTGRYAHVDGWRSITDEIPRDQVSLLDHLKHQGYQTAVLGKNHAWEDLFQGRVQFHSWTGDFETRYLAQKAGRPAPGVSRRTLPTGYEHRGAAPFHWSDDAYTEQAELLLTERFNQVHPFFLQVNLEAPHPLYAVEEPWYSGVDPAKIQAFPHELPSGAPLNLRAMRRIRTSETPDPEALREVQATYLAMIHKVDAQVGRILDALERSGRAQDTLILFWVDHGDFAGQYGLVEKWDTCFADCLLRIPCILAGPGVPVGTYRGLSSTVDLAPTITGLLGLPPLPRTQGSDLRPALAGAAGPQAVFADGGHEDAMIARYQEQLTSRPKLIDSHKQRVYAEEPDTMARATCIRTATHKLVLRLRGGNELYDLAADPWELTNRFGDPALTGVRADLLQRLMEWRLATDTDLPRRDQFGA